MGEDTELLEWVLGFHPSVRISCVYSTVGEGRRKQRFTEHPGVVAAIYVWYCPVHFMRMNSDTESLITQCQIGKQNFRDVDSSATSVVSLPTRPYMFPSGL